ncbi:MAG: hypothetical protein NTX61_14405 [Bacteroidetes bacterium]|nr:hypothetical protein [Bacteroidota bacterium]
MKKRYILIFLLCTGTLFRLQDSHAEGSKEIWVGTYMSYLFICTDFVTHCEYTNFAAYGCDETSRLCFVTKNTDEIAYFGFNLEQSDIPSGNTCVFRIKDLSGTVVYPETPVPITAIPGYIYFVSQARIGPAQIYGASGYNAIDWHPPAAGTYYMEFQVIDNISGAPTPRGFRMNIFDLTVYDSVALQVKPGRLYSKAWQYEETLNYAGTVYPYSSDSIATSVAVTNLDGGIWNVFCNQWGCANTSNFASDRKSVHQLAYLPQYPVFLNPPDTTIFQPAKILGQIVPPDPWGETNCTSGNIIFHVHVNKAGTLEIDLHFPSPFTTRILIMNGVAGENLLTWNGLDGSGVMVPNNILVTYAIKYIYGLTNLPMFDIEENLNGFTIGLVSPAGNAPRIYWDDSNITGGTTNLTGCLNPPGCHPISLNFGNANTINTWWYSVSDSTDPVTIVEKRLPQALVFNSSLPQHICSTLTGVYYAVTPDVNTDIYHWGYTGTGVTIHQAFPSDNFITIDIASNATSGDLTVYGTNANCPGNGPTSSLSLTISGIPILNLPYSGNICTGNSTNILLTSTPPGATFSWTSPAPGCTANITVCPPGQDNATQITDLLSLSDNNPGMVTYHITPTISQCTGSVQDYVLTVNPPSAPSVTISASENPVCAGSSVTFTASPVNGGASPAYQWLVNGGGIWPNAPTMSYIPTNGDIITCILTSSNTVCISNNPATSNAISMVVNPLLTVSVSINTPDNPFCQGSMVTFTATPANGGSTPSYQWKVNGIGVGTNNPIYSFSPNNGDLVSCILNSSIECPSGNPATSNTITMTENTVNPVSIVISTPVTAVCSGTSVTFTATPTNGGTSPTYHWKVNGINAGTNSFTFGYMPVNGDVVSCALTSNLACASGNPATSNTITMTVNPNLPVSIAISVPSNNVCSGSQVTATATAINAGSSPVYQWKVDGVDVGTNSNTYTFIPAFSIQLSCILNSSIICASGNPATSNTITMTVNPNLPVSVSISASVNPVCSGIPVTYSATPTNGGSNPTYQWVVDGVGVSQYAPTMSYTPANGDLVSCFLTSNSICATGNPATSNIITMNVFISPLVTFTRCNDSITTVNAQPFRLKGGIPLGGTYSGPGVTNGIFYPAIAGAGTKTITYSYTNVALCSGSASRSLVISQLSLVVCGNILTDIRDGNVYPTVQIGSQCWLASNLNFGTMIPGSISQRDNCTAEKYCLNDITANCQLGTANYQWDEIMAYDETLSTQGLCPPGWHVPTEPDWNTMFAVYINNAFAAWPLLYTGYSGFNATLSGARHMNKTWDWSGFATFFWSSTSHGINKAWSHGMNDTDPSVSLYPAFRSNAFSVRCLKDN